MTVDECPQCKGIWLDNSKLNEFHQNPSCMFIEYENLKDSNIKNIDYYYYKSEFIENGSVNDLFDFEFK